MSGYCSYCGYMYCECRSFENFLREQDLLNRVHMRRMNALQKQAEANYKEFFHKGVACLFANSLMDIT